MRGLCVVYVWLGHILVNEYTKNLALDWRWSDVLLASTFTIGKTLTFFNMQKMKWNESGFRPPLCTYRLNWARRTSWGWWDDWDDTVLQTQDSKFEPWRSEAEHATSRSRRLPTILTFTRGWGRNIFVSFKPPKPGTEPRTLAWKAAVITTTLGPPPFLNTQKMCAEVDAHNKWITFIRRSRQIINVFWRTPSESKRTPSESQRTAQNSPFFVRSTCVMVCVTGPLA